MSIGLFASLAAANELRSPAFRWICRRHRPLWPDYSVEQPLDGVPDVISEVRIWARAGFDRGEGLIVASLLQGRDYQLVRQLKFPIKAGRILRSYVLTFPSYQPAPGEKLVLQLWVSKRRSDGRPANNHVIFGTSEPGTGMTPLTLNGRPTGHGALAHEFIWTGAGWRAPLAGSIPDLARLAGAIAAAAIAAAMTLVLPPFISRTMRKTMRKVRTAFLTFDRSGHRVLGRARISQRAKSLRADAPSRRRGFYVFPWLIPAFAILHYLANNQPPLSGYRTPSQSRSLSWRSSQPYSSRSDLSSRPRPWPPCSRVCSESPSSHTATYISPWANGPTTDTLWGWARPWSSGLGALAVRRAEFARRMARFSASQALCFSRRRCTRLRPFICATPSPTGELSQESVDLDERVAEARARITENELRDIYYIILDKYPRSGSPPESTTARS